MSAARRRRVMLDSDDDDNEDDNKGKGKRPVRKTRAKRPQASTQERRHKIVVPDVEDHDEDDLLSLQDSADDEHDHSDDHDETERKRKQQLAERWSKLEEDSDHDLSDGENGEGRRKSAMIQMDVQDTLTRRARTRSSSRLAVNDPRSGDDESDSEDDGLGGFIVDDSSDAEEEPITKTGKGTSRAGGDRGRNEKRSGGGLSSGSDSSDSSDSDSRDSAASTTLKGDDKPPIRVTTSRSGKKRKAVADVASQNESAGRAKRGRTAGKHTETGSATAPGERRAGNSVTQKGVEDERKATRSSRGLGRLGKGEEGMETGSTTSNNGTSSGSVVDAVHTGHPNGNSTREQEHEGIMGPGKGIRKSSRLRQTRLQIGPSTAAPERAGAAAVVSGVNARKGKRNARSTACVQLKLQGGGGGLKARPTASATATSARSRGKDNDGESDESSSGSQGSSSSSSSGSSDGSDSSSDSGSRGSPSGKDAGAQPSTRKSRMRAASRAATKTSAAASSSGIAIQARRSKGRAPDGEIGGKSEKRPSTTERGSKDRKVAADLAESGTKAASGKKQRRDKAVSGMGDVSSERRERRRRSGNASTVAIDVSSDDSDTDEEAVSMASRSKDHRRADKKVEQASAHARGAGEMSSRWGGRGDKSGGNVGAGKPKPPATTRTTRLSSRAQTRSLRSTNTSIVDYFKTKPTNPRTSSTTSSTSLKTTPTVNRANISKDARGNGSAVGSSSDSDSDVMGSEENSEGRCGRDEDADEDDGFAETLEDDAEAEDEEYDEGDDDGVRSSKRRRRGSQTRRNGRGRDSGGTVRYEDLDGDDNDSEDHDDDDDDIDDEDEQEGNEDEGDMSFSHAAFFHEMEQSQEGGISSLSVETMTLKEAFLHYVEFIAKATAGGGAGEEFMGKYVAHPRLPEHARYGKAKDMVEKKVCVTRESLCGTWRQDFRDSILRYPHYGYQNVDTGAEEHCSACNRSNRTKVIAFLSGSEYDPRRVWESLRWDRYLPEHWDEPHAMAVSKQEIRATHFLGDTCKHKSHLYHSLVHYKLYLVSRITAKMRADSEVEPEHFRGERGQKKIKKKKRKRCLHFSENEFESLSSLLEKAAELNGVKWGARAGVKGGHGKTFLQAGAASSILGWLSGEHHEPHQVLNHLGGGLEGGDSDDDDDDDEEEFMAGSRRSWRTSGRGRRGRYA